MLNRAVQGAYPPGSVFKIVTAAALLTNLPEMAGDTINCTGQLEISGFTLHDNAVHGNVDLKMPLPNPAMWPLRGTGWQ